jgi:hypothetical protein
MSSPRGIPLRPLGTEAKPRGGLSHQRVVYAHLRLIRLFRDLVTMEREELS